MYVGCGAGLLLCAVGCLVEAAYASPPLRGLAEVSAGVFFTAAALQWSLAVMVWRTRR